jgi:hypothetical protein
MVGYTPKLYSQKPAHPISILKKHSPSKPASTVSVATADPLRAVAFNPAQAQTQPIVV